MIPTRPLLEAIAAQDFTALRACLADSVAFRALVPPGVLEADNADAAVERFRRWFGGPDTVEVLEAADGEIGDKTILRWRVRRTAPDGRARLVEQHLFLTGGARVDTVDLLCSGFVER